MNINRTFKILNVTKVGLGLVTLLALTLLTSCGDDDGGMESPTNDILEIADANNDLTFLVTALGKFPNLETTLSDESGSYTVFAPTNAAFAALLEATGQTDLDDIPEDVIRRVLEYHVVAGATLLSTDLTDGQTASTVLGETIQVGVSGTSVTINGANVTTANVEASNGVVHIIDGILVPSLEASILNTVVEPAYFNTDFSFLTDAVITAGLLNTLIDQSADLTVFAPTDDAFRAAGITSLDGLTADDLTPILQYHVLGSEVKAADLPATGSAVTTLNGDFYLSINSDGVFINGSTEVVATDLDYDNGVVHVIDRTLMPPSSNVVEIAVAASTATEAEFGQLVAALTAVENDANAANLITALSDASGSFTVFAPTDAAFQALYTLAGVSDFAGLIALEGVDLNTIATVLQYHVLQGRVFSSDLPNVLDGGMTATITPLAGGTFTLNSSLTLTDVDGVLSLGTSDATIVDTDILGTNGVIHVINQVILP